MGILRRHTELHDPDLFCYNCDFFPRHGQCPVPYRCRLCDSIRKHVDERPLHSKKVPTNNPRLIKLALKSYEYHWRYNDEFKTE